jgi:adenosylmethionine-8-amino-7-oxononanoate aminotransferase
MGADTTYPQLVELAEQLAQISHLQHVFFASDGSSAVEIAMKLALHAKQLEGHDQRNQFIALKNAYHGETLATLGVSDLGLYKKPYQQLNLSCHFLQNIPYVSGKQDPLWQDCGEAWRLAEHELTPYKENACALIIEPIVQGAGGMLIYSADFLRRLIHWAKQNQIIVIADEIMTGVGRTGQWLASELAGIQPDLICLSKGLTSGALPLSCVLIDDDIYQLFYSDYADGKSFLHSHTYSGNPLAVSAALATLKVMQAESTPLRAQQLGAFMHECFLSVADQCGGKIERIRSVGAIVAGDLIGPADKRLGFKLQQEALRQGAFLRPIGNTLYWLPPLNTSNDTIEQLAEITLSAVNAVYKNT